MKKYVINYEDGVKSDILCIIDYIENKYGDSYNALKVAVKIYKKCESLAYFPKGSPIHHEWGSQKELRAVHIKGYTIIYYIDKETSIVNIRAVVNSCRDIISIISKK